jgi:hypothetical protein
MQNAGNWLSKTANQVDQGVQSLGRKLGATTEQVSAMPQYVYTKKSGHGNIGDIADVSSLHPDDLAEQVKKKLLSPTPGVANQAEIEAANQAGRRGARLRGYGALAVGGTGLGLGANALLNRGQQPQPQTNIYNQ